jgi:hypothetical protein
MANNRLRSWTKWVIAPLLIIAAAMILGPRVWVQNKVATLTVDGKKQTNFRLYHGSSNRVLIRWSTGVGFDLRRVQPLIYEESALSPIIECLPKGFIDAKVLVFEVEKGLCIAQSKADILNVRGSSQSVEFKMDGHDVKISWQPRPARPTRKAQPLSRAFFLPRENSPLTSRLALLPPPSAVHFRRAASWTPRCIRVPYRRHPAHAGSAFLS